MNIEVVCVVKNSQGVITWVGVNDGTRDVEHGRRALESIDRMLYSYWLNVDNLKAIYALQ